MADQTVANWGDFLYELRGPMQQLFPSEFVLMAEIDRTTRDQGPNQDREIFSGNQVRVPILPVPHQGGGFVAEAGTWNVPIAQETNKATITMARYVMPVSVTPDLLQTALNNAAAQAMATLVKTARVGIARDENTALQGDGTGLLGTFVSGTSPGLGPFVIGTAANPANADEFYPGRVLDILTKSNGADPGQGLRRKISVTTDNNDGTISVTFLTGQQASDGGTGSITISTNEGFYLPGSYGNVCQGLQQGLAITGTFEGIDKAAKAYWQAIDGRSGTTTVVPLTTSMLDGAVRKVWVAGVTSFQFAIGDPAVFDLYKQSLYTQTRWAGQTGTLATGFEGVSYNGTVLVGDHQHKRGSMSFLTKDALQMYGFKPGPDFLDDDGSMFRRFTRTLPKEFDLVDWYQFGFLRCNPHVFLNNLARAA